MQRSKRETDDITAHIESDPVTGEPLILRTDDGAANMYIHNGTGNPEALLTTTGQQAAAYKYDPYGVPEVTASTSPTVITANPYLFKQGIQDRTTGWVKYGARWYSPETGRFTQRDPLDAPLDPMNANRYVYAANDPINNSDPTGLICYSFNKDTQECGYYGPPVSGPSQSCRRDSAIFGFLLLGLPTGWSAVMAAMSGASMVAGCLGM